MSALPPKADIQSDPKFGQFYLWLFLKYPKLPCDYLEGKGEERPTPAPEVDLSKAPTPIVELGRA